MKDSPRDFSFSGLKTAVLRWVESHDMTAEIEARRALLAATPKPTDEQWLALTPPLTRDLAASFQHTVIEELLSRAAAAAESIGARSVIVTGGVACNSGLHLAATKTRLGVPVHFPSYALSTDNAVMIAAAAFPKWFRRDFQPLSAAIEPNLPLGN